MDEMRLSALSEMQFSNDDLFNFNTNNENMHVMNPLLHNFDGVFISQSDGNEYCCTMPMENGKIVNLNLPQSPEKNQENFNTCTAGSVKSSPTGIIPCQDEFGGNLNFEVMLDTSSQSYRQKWNYSVTLQKIFIDINKVLLLNFKCDYDKISSNTPLFIRALPMYSAADWLKEPVNRCLQHLSPIDKFNKGFTHLDHVIRCDNDSTTYHVDQFSNRKSVVTLLCRPEHGLDSTKLSYRFVCKTSCLGGMERRPIIVIFTLEDYNGQVLGRRILPVKICTCPKRDMEREEKDRKLKKNEVFRRNKKCISQESNKHCHSDNDGSTPCKILKLESHSSTESDTENTINKSFSITYTADTLDQYKKVVESVYCAIAGVSLLHNIKNTQHVLKDLNSILKNLN